MTTLLAVLLLFVLAFAGMSLGGILGRKTLRNGCGGGDTQPGCHCSSKKHAESLHDHKKQF